MLSIARSEQPWSRSASDVITACGPDLRSRTQRSFSFSSSSSSSSSSQSAASPAGLTMNMEIPEYGNSVDEPSADASYEVFSSNKKENVTRKFSAGCQEMDDAAMRNVCTSSPRDQSSEEKAEIVGTEKSTENIWSPDKIMSGHDNNSSMVDPYLFSKSDDTNTSHSRSEESSNQCRTSVLNMNTSDIKVDEGQYTQSSRVIPRIITRIISGDVRNKQRDISSQSVNSSYNENVYDSSVNISSSERIVSAPLKSEFRSEAEERNVAQWDSEGMSERDRRYFVTPKKARWKLHDLAPEPLEEGEDTLQASPLSDGIIDDAPFFPSPSHHDKPHPSLFHRSSPQYRQGEGLEGARDLEQAPPHLISISEYDEDMMYTRKMTSHYDDDTSDVRYDHEKPSGERDEIESENGMTIEERNQARLRNLTVKSKDILSCHLCSFIGQDEQSYSSHMRSAHFKNLCPYCGYSSRTIGRLRRHVTDFHSNNGSANFSGTDPSKTKRQRRHRCRECNFISDDQTEYWIHIRTHIPTEKQLLCPHCAFVTACKHHMEYHLRNHLGSKPFKCNYCNYQCINKAMLKSHMKSHSNMYPYRCADCSYAAKYVHALNMHLQKTGHTVWVEGDGKSGRAGRSLTRIRGLRRLNSKGPTNQNKFEGPESQEGLDLDLECERNFEKRDQTNDRQLQLKIEQHQLHNEHMRIQQLHRQQTEQQQQMIRQEQLILQLRDEQQRRRMREEGQQLHAQQLYGQQPQQLHTQQSQQLNEQLIERREAYGHVARYIEDRYTTSQSAYAVRENIGIHRRSPNSEYIVSSSRGDLQNEHIASQRWMVSKGLTGQGFAQTIPSIASFSRRSPPSLPPPLILYDQTDSQSMYHETGRLDVGEYQKADRSIPHKSSIAEEPRAMEWSRERSPGRRMAAQPSQLSQQIRTIFHSQSHLETRNAPLDLSSNRFDIQPTWRVEEEEDYKSQESRLVSGSRKRSHDWGEREGPSVETRRARTADWPTSEDVLRNAAHDWVKSRQNLNATSHSQENLNRDLSLVETRPRAGSFPSSLARAEWKRGRMEPRGEENAEYKSERESYPTSKQEQFTGASDARDEYKHSVAEYEKYSGHQNGRSIAYSVVTKYNEQEISPYENRLRVAPAYPLNDRRYAELQNDPVSEIYSKINSERQVEKVRTPEKLSEEENGSIECEYCRIIFPDYILYTLHMGYHTRDDPFLCNKCGHRTQNHREFFLHIAKVAHD